VKLLITIRTPDGCAKKTKGTLTWMLFRKLHIISEHINKEDNQLDLRIVCSTAQTFELNKQLAMYGKFVEMAMTNPAVIKHLLPKVKNYNKEEFMDMIHNQTKITIEKEA
jgi:hypothetical protein